MASLLNLVGFWVAREFNIKNFKKAVHYWQRLSDIRDKASMEPVQKESHPGLLVVYSKDWQQVFIFSLQGPGVSTVVDSAVLIKHPHTICTKTIVLAFPSCLNSRCSLFFHLTNRCLSGFFSRIGHFHLHLEISAQADILSHPMSSLMASGSSSAPFDDKLLLLLS